MRIVQFIIGTYGGAERFFVRLSAALSARQTDHLVIVNDNEELVEDVRRAGLQYKILPLSRFGSFADRAVVAGHCKDFGADVVVAWMNRAARRLPKGAHVNVGRLGGYYPVKNYKTCKYLIGNTPGIVNSCKEQGWPPDRIQLISNFYEPSIAKNKPTGDVSRNPFTLCALGRFDRWKGFDTLLSALARHDDVHLLLAGQGEQERALREKVSQLSIGDRVKFLGWVDDRESLMKQAHLCVIPSHHEPLGNVILEAWSVGCPVIAAASEGPSWLIEHGSTGYLVAPGNVEELSAAITFAKNNAELRENWARAAYSRWQQEFSEDVICDQYIRFFKEVLGQTV